MKTKIFGFIAGTLFIAGCAHDPIIYKEPHVTVSMDDTLHIYQNGDTIHMNITMEDDDELHEAFVYVITPANTDTFFSFQPYVHELPSYSLDTFCLISGVTALQEGFVTVIATNHHDKLTEINVPITVFP
jgi:hypothetical protein